MTEPPLPPRVRSRVLVPFAGCTLIWGSTWLAVRYQLGTVPAQWSITYRFAISCIVMFAVARAMRLPAIVPRRTHALAAGIGATLFVFNYQFVYASEAYIASGLVAVVSALILVFNAIFGRIFLGQQVSRPFMLGSAVALGGIVLLFAHEMGNGIGSSHNMLLGVGLAFCGLISASISNVLQGTELSRHVPAPTLLAWSMLYGTAMDAAAALVMTGPPVFDPRIGYILPLVYLAVAGSAVAFTLYLGVIRAIGPARAAYSAVLTPVIAMLLSTLFEGYRWSAGSAAGAALALGGLALALRTPRPAR